MIILVLLYGNRSFLAKQATIDNKAKRFSHYNNFNSVIKSYDLIIFLTQHR